MICEDFLVALFSFLVGTFLTDQTHGRPYKIDGWPSISVLC
jgi:hypothetical protein